MSRFTRAVIVVIAAIPIACVARQFQNGEACFKDQDCQSGVCLAQVCAPPHPTTDQTTEDAAAADASDAGADGDGATDSASDAGDAACEACP